MPRKLLLVDDSATTQQVVELILSEEGFQLLSVSSSQEALDKISEFNPSIVLADADLPDIDGYSLCQQLKSNDTTKHIPVIMLVGAFATLNENKIKDCGASDYLVKPFDSPKFLNTVHSVLGPSVADGGVTAFEDSKQTLDVIGDTGVFEEGIPASGDTDEFKSLTSDSDLTTRELKDVLENLSSPDSEKDHSAGTGIVADVPTNIDNVQDTVVAAFAASGVTHPHESSLNKQKAALPPHEGKSHQPVAPHSQASVHDEPLTNHQPPHIAETAVQPSEPFSENVLMTESDVSSLLQRTLEEAALQFIDESAVMPIVREAVKDYVNDGLQDVAMGINGLVSNAINQKISEVIGTTNLEIIVNQVIASTIKGLLTTLPAEIFKMTREITEREITSSLTDNTPAMKKDVEQVIWEAVPDVAARLVKQEIERIESEFI
ncbi:MAG: response regulator [Candidatus Magnetominusculus sp. LBB02]|nr:response regulator [Candidatus Magnetominusculus sp. LBB02]